LVGEPFADLAEALRFFCATQGQDYAGAKWSLGERLRGVTDAELDAAFDAGEILRTHVMRPTWHLVAPDDLPWLLELTAPRVHVALGYAYRRFDLDQRVFARGHEAIERALAPGESLLRDDLVAALEQAGVGGERLRQHHVLIHAELEGLICSGPRRGKQHTYALLAERAPNARRLERDEALAELARRYFSSHAPATIRDFSWWSGLTVAESRRAVDLAGGEIREAFTEAGTPWYEAGDAAEAAPLDEALLVGMFDESVIAYRDLRFAFDTRPADLAPLIRPIVIGGRTVGTWKRTIARGAVTVVATPFGRLAPAEIESLEAAAARLGAFLGLPTSVTIEPAV
jgi:hypothetical protein